MSVRVLALEPERTLLPRRLDADAADRRGVADRPGVHERAGEQERLRAARQAEAAGIVVERPVAAGEAEMQHVVLVLGEPRRVGQAGGRGDAVVLQAGVDVAAEHARHRGPVRTVGADGGAEVACRDESVGLRALGERGDVVADELVEAERLLEVALGEDDVPKTLVGDDGVAHRHPRLDDVVLEGELEVLEAVIGLDPGAPDRRRLLEHRAEAPRLLPGGRVRRRPARHGRRPAPARPPAFPPYPTGWRAPRGSTSATCRDAARSARRRCRRSSAAARDRRSHRH